MKMFKKIVLACLIASPLTLSAAGIGLYVPYSLGDTMEVTVTPDNSTPDFDQTTEYDSALGLGLMFDSNLGKDKLFNYRLGLEFMNRKVDTVSSGGVTRSCTGDACDMFRFQIVQTFGFGVLRTEMVRLWVGPRINLGYNYQNDEEALFTQTNVNFEVGIAPAVGINLNFGRYFALSADLDYRFSGVGGGYTYDLNGGTSVTNSYKGSNNGATLRVAAIFKFGEDFQDEIHTADDY